MANLFIQYLSTYWEGGKITLNVMLLSTILAGVFTAIESGIMSQLGKQITPSVATMYRLATEFIDIAAVRFLRGASSKVYMKAFSVSPLYIIGGILGTAIIYLSAKAIPTLGISKTLTLIVVAQTLTGFAMDAFINPGSISVYRIAGAFFLSVTAPFRGCHGLHNIT